MGTRGLYSYRYKKRYYTKYHNNDSYLDGLGSELRYQIPTTPEEIQKWIVKEQARMQKIHDEYVEDDEDCDTDEPPTLEDEPPKRDVFIEYAYIIDLDNGVFSVNGHETKGWVHLQFDKIPEDNWEEALKSGHPAQVQLPEPLPESTYDSEGDVSF